MAAETRILLLCTIVLSMSPVTTQTTWDDVTDLDTVIERLAEKKMETMTRQLEDRLTQQQARRDKELLDLLERHVQDKERLEDRVREQGELLGKLQDQLFQQRKEEERKMKILTQRIEVLELQVKVNMAATEGQDKQTHGVVTPEDEDSAEEAVSVSRNTTLNPPRELNEVTADVQALKNANVLNEQARGSAYVRWGSNGCPNSSELVYSGYVGGSWYDSTGAAANELCLPPDPVFDGHTAPRYGVADLYGAEYGTCDEPECDLTPVCAVCRVPRAAVVMVPGKNTCWPEWTLEYSGYIMAGHASHHGASEYICVDKSRAYLPGSKANDNGYLLHYTIARCGSLPCQPYVEGKIVLCAVCSK